MLPHYEPPHRALTQEERALCARLDALYYVDIDGARACDCLGSGWTIRRLPDGRLAIEGPNLGLAEVRP
jgi:hypothetical protein